MNRMIDKDPPWPIIMFCLGLALLCIGLGSGMIGCNHPDMPPIDVTFWAGDSAKGGITRSQDHVTLLATDPKFDEMACLTYKDVQKLYSTMLTCKDWGDQPKMSANEVETLKEKNHALVRRLSNENVN